MGGLCTSSASGFESRDHRSCSAVGIWGGGGSNDEEDRVVFSVGIRLGGDWRMDRLLLVADRWSGIGGRI